MDSVDSIYCASRAEWRGWLEKNHDKKKAIWLIFYKKGSGKPRVTYEDAVEEALCFGWIDSIARGIDGESYAQRFTPRKADSEWSETNVARVERLIKEGRMTEAGLAKYMSPTARKAEAWKLDSTFPPALVEALEKNPKAREYFSGLSVSQKKLFFRWINDAKRDATRQKRIGESIELLAQGKKLTDK